MKNLKIWLSAAIVVLAIIAITGIFITAITTDAYASTSCPDQRCDYRNGTSYGCILYAPDKDCAYTAGTCTGWKNCKPNTDPEVD